MSFLEEVFDVFIISYSEDDKTQAYAKLLTDTIIPSFKSKHRILFYKSPISKTAFVRNIDPLIHIDYDEEFSESIIKHVNVLLTYNSLSAPSEANQVLIHKVHDGRIRARLRSLADILEVDLRS